MAKTKILEIARAILGSFNSRNNDVSGYWGIGILFFNAEKQNENIISFDLLQNLQKDEIKEVCFLKGVYKHKLFNYLKIYNIENWKIKNAFIIITFSEKSIDNEHNYKLEVKIIDIDGQEYIVSTSGYVKNFGHYCKE